MSLFKKIFPNMKPTLKVFVGLMSLGIIFAATSLGMVFHQFGEAGVSTESFPNFISDKDLSNSGISCKEEYGVSGKGCYFKNKSINISTLISQKITAQEGTIMMWLQPKDLSFRQYPLFGTSKTEVNRFYIQLEPPLDNLGIGSRIRLFRGNNELKTNVDLIQNPDTNTWYHVAMTWKQEGEDLRLYGYLDGELIGTGEFKGESISGNFFFGGNRNSEYYNGYIDEPQFHKKALTQNEILAHIDTVFPPPVEVEPDIYPNFLTDSEINTLGLDCKTEYGVSGKGCYFNKTTIDISQKVSQELTAENGTVMMWLNPHDFSTRQYPFWGVANPGVNRFYLQLEPEMTLSDGRVIGDRIRVFRGDNNLRASVDLIQNPDTHTWYHVAMTWSPINNDELELKGYLNGELIGTREFKGTSLSGNFYLGGNGSKEQFVGYIDEPQLHNTALTEEQISQHFNQYNPYPDIFTIVRHDLTNLRAINYPNREAIITSPIDSTLFKNHIQDSIQPALRESIDAISMDAGLGWIPLWKTGNCNPLYGEISTSPYQGLIDHNNWWREVTTRPVRYNTMYTEFILLGDTSSCNNPNDIFDIFIQQVHQSNKLAIVNFRLNDHQGLSRLLNADIDRAANVAANEFVYNNTDYMLDKNSTSDWDKALDWSNPEVIQNRLDLIRPIIQNYDIDGFELDFMRFPYYFPKGSKTLAQQNIILNFITEVSNMIEEKESKTGKDIILGIRLSDQIAITEDIPVKYEKLNPNQIDYVVVQPIYHTAMPRDIQDIRKKLNDDINLVYEFSHVTGRIYVPDGTTIDASIETKTSFNQILTLGNLAYKQGARGISALNIHYYQEYGANSEVRGPWNPPPYEVYDILNDSKELQNFNLHNYFISAQSKTHVPTALVPQLLTNETQRLNKGAEQILTIYTQTPTNGWQEDGILRILGNRNLNSKEFTVSFNGTQLTETSEYTGPVDIYNPTPSPNLGELTEYNGLNCITKGACYKYWIVPKALLREGLSSNSIRFYIKDSNELFSIMYSDISF